MIGLLLRIALPWIGGIAALLVLWGWLTSGAYDRGVKAERDRARTELDRAIDEARRDAQTNNALPEDVLDRKYRCLRARVRGEATTPDCERILRDLPARPAR